MTNTPTPPPTLTQLQQKWQVQERPFQSNIPLVARLRTAWNNIATKWYVRPIVQQQNEFNRLTTSHLEEIAERFDELNDRLITQDKDQTALAHDIGELTTQLIQTNRLLKSIDERLSQLEKG